MTDQVFMARLHGYAYAPQRGGYGTGSVPVSFQPIIPFFKNDDGTVNRQRTLEMPAFGGIDGIELTNLLAITKE